MNKTYFVYILSSKPNGTLYIGVTSDLGKRIWEHKQKIVKGFTKKYSVDKLVYYEEFANINDAILREKRLKKWNRDWKLDLIEKLNPCWSDLYENILTTQFQTLDSHFRGNDKKSQGNHGVVIVDSKKCHPRLRSGIQNKTIVFPFYEHENCSCCGHRSFYCDCRDHLFFQNQRRSCKLVQRQLDIPYTIHSFQRRRCRH